MIHKKIKENKKLYKKEGEERKEKIYFQISFKIYFSHNQIWQR